MPVLRDWFHSPHCECGDDPDTIPASQWDLQWSAVKTTFPKRNQAKQYRIDEQHAFRAGFRDAVSHDVCARQEREKRNGCCSWAPNAGRQPVAVESAQLLSERYDAVLHSILPAPSSGISAFVHFTAAVLAAEKVFRLVLSFCSNRCVVRLGLFCKCRLQ